MGDKQCRWATLLATGINVGNRIRKCKCSLATRLSYVIQIKGAMMSMLNNLMGKYLQRSTARLCVEELVEIVAGGGALFLCQIS